MSQPFGRRSAGIALALVVLSAAGLMIGLYNKSFANPLEVTIETSRAGLVMEAGNSVKMRGIEIGEVADVRQGDGGRGAELVVHIDSDYRDRIPAEVSARIEASTVFGAKYVDLVEPKKSSREHLEAGAVIDATGVTREVNTVFKSLGRVLDHVDVAELSNTMTVLARTLDGRGASLAGIADKADAYLTELEPMLPVLREDLHQLSRTAELADKISPALFRILENATVTAHTVSSEQDSLRRLLVDLRILGVDGARVLGIHGDTIQELLRAALPTADTLKAYSSELPCLLLGLERSNKLVGGAMGGRSPGLRAYISVRSGHKAYTYENDLPQLPSGSRASCDGLPFITQAEIDERRRNAP